MGDLWQQLKNLFSTRGLRVVLGGFVAVTVLALGYTAYEVVTWPDVEALADARPERTAFIDLYLTRGADADEESELDWRWVPYDRISPHLKRAVVVAEDIGFFSHNGFAYDEIRVAIREAVTGDRVRGASTITQQLAKNLWLSPSQNPLRKVKEAMLTRQLEETLDKKRILELYMNAVEFGPGIYGAEAAAQRYFGKAALDLNEREAALLAASLPRPSSWHPGNESPSYLRYAADIEDRMDRAEFLWRRI